MIEFRGGPLAGQLKLIPTPHPPEYIAAVFDCLPPVRGPVAVMDHVYQLVRAGSDEYYRYAGPRFVVRGKVASADVIS